MTNKTSNSKSHDKHQSPFAPAKFPKLPAIRGLKIATAAAEIRYKNRTDVVLMLAEAGSQIAGVFTRSSTRSAPVLQCQANLQARLTENPHSPLAIMINSGCSNAFTGKIGVHSVQEITKALCAATGCTESSAFHASTGVIGEPLPHDRIIKTIPELISSLGEGRWHEAGKAIMTTDTYPKGATTSLKIDDQTVTLCGIAKGAGMIAPDMATMLSFVATDANITQPVLQYLLKDAVKDSFNAITIDSDTSTSDTLLFIATGKADHTIITEITDPRLSSVKRGLRKILKDLAHQVVKDGEGVTKFAQITVMGAKSSKSAKKIAMNIANSPLVKTAMAGNDPNWGRIVMAVGKSGEPADRDKLSIKFGPILVAEKGMVAPDYKEADGIAHMTQPNIIITVDVGVGKGKATVWTCDLTHEYVSINGSYRS